MLGFSGVGSAAREVAVCRARLVVSGGTALAVLLGFHRLAFAMVRARTKSEGEGSVGRHPLSYDGIGLLKTRELAWGLGGAEQMELFVSGAADDGERGFIAGVCPAPAMCGDRWLETGSPWAMASDDALPVSFDAPTDH